jgi:hypothetical protein
MTINLCSATVQKEDWSISIQDKFFNRWKETEKEVSF